MAERSALLSTGIFSCPIFEGFRSAGFSVPGDVIVDPVACSGCGLCLSLCPESCFALKWE